MSIRLISEGKTPGGRVKIKAFSAPLFALLNARLRHAPRKSRIQK
jgi:hypothetical protein